MTDQWCARRDVPVPGDVARLLEVKTLGPSHPDPAYARTRRFYEKMGFLALEETDLWGEDTPCPIMVKSLAG